MASPFKKTKLGNGITLVTVPMKETASATILVFYPVGSRHESPELAGGSHFVEHLMFKGTRRRPDTTHISRELDAVGSEYNAFTSKDHTGYYVKVASEHLPMAADMLADMLSESLFDATEMEREKGVIIEEIRMYEDNPMMQLDDVFEEALFPGSTLGRNIAGTVETMTAMKREDVIRYRDMFYRPGKATVIVAGKLPSNVMTLVKKTFGAIKDTKAPKAKPFAKFVVTPALGNGPEAKVKFKETEQVHLAVGYPAYGYGDKRLPALSMLAVILGGNMSSRLFIQVRERRGLCYYIRTSLARFEDVGAFMVSAGLKKDKLDEGVKSILEEIAKLRDRGVEAEELARAKEYLKGKTVLSLEETSEVADWYGRQQLFLGKMETPAEKMRKIDAVTAAEVLKVAKDVLRHGRLRLAVIGPFKDAARFDKLIK